MEEFCFKSETGFNNYLNRNVTENTRRYAVNSHAVPYAIVLKRGDLNPRVIVNEKGKITCIVDCEIVGFSPEHWEHAKIHCTVRHVGQWLAGVVDQVFEGFWDLL